MSRGSSHKVEKVTVAGAGTMGHGIAELSALAGYHVKMYDISQDILKNAVEKIRWSLKKLAEKGVIKEQKVEEALSMISPTLNIQEAVADCDILIEAIPEEISIKSKFFSEVDTLAPEQAIFASNTSSLPITELASSTKRQDRFVGLHFFNPPVLMKLVEVIRGANTSDETVKVVIKFAESLGKEVVICKKDVAGFIVNRVLGAMINEAGWIVYRNEASILEVDSALKYKLGLPMGAFELMDYSGIDIFYHVSETIASRERGFLICPLFKEYYDKGWLGKKTGKGFYDYAGKEWERPSIPREAGEKVDPVSIMAPAINAAAWLVSNDVATVEDIDKAVKLGLGFPEGILRMADKFGIRKIVSILKEKEEKYGSYYSPDPLLVMMEKEGKTGVDAGKGFYDYAGKQVAYEEIIVKKEPPIAWVILNRPHRLNAITLRMVDEIDEALNDLEKDEGIRVLIFKGSGERAFCAGFDVTSFTEASVQKAYILSKRLQDLFSRIESFPKPTVAAIDGYCLGGGCELACSCDLRIATERAEIGQPEIKLGIIPGAGGTQRLPKIVGLGRAKEIVMLGERVRSSEALRMGLVNKVVDNEKLDEESRALATKLADGPPVALRAAKVCLNTAVNIPTEEGLKVEASHFAGLFATEDVIEGVRAFLERRKPEFKGM